MSAYEPPEEDDGEEGYDSLEKSRKITEERFGEDESGSFSIPNPVSAYRDLNTYEKAQYTVLGGTLLGLFGTAFFIFDEGAREGAAEFLKDLGIELTTYPARNPESMEYVRQALENGF